MNFLWFLIGLAIILGVLAAVGITRNRLTSQKNWVIIWTFVSFLFAAFVLIAFLVDVPDVSAAALGGSLGFVLAISIHVLHHTLEEIQKEKDAKASKN